MQSTVPEPITFHQVSSEDHIEEEEEEEPMVFLEVVIVESLVTHLLEMVLHPEETFVVVVEVEHSLACLHAKIYS